jgi:hypothetical protein
MLKQLITSAILSLGLLVASAQSNAVVSKECRISTGMGVAGASKNFKKTGETFWLQLDYRLHENFSVAFDFENMNYKQPGYYRDLPFDPNEINVFNNNFSVFVKYHVNTKQKLKLAFVSGWTYCIKQNEYYYSANLSSPNGVAYIPNVSSYNEYRLPILIETNYPISKKVAINARARYNLNTQSGNTYSAGLGLSLKL